jgi:hypothetical protein
MYSTLLVTALLAIAGSALGQDCAEAARFGTSFFESSAPDLAAGEVCGRAEPPPSPHPDRGPAPR